MAKKEFLARLRKGLSGLPWEELEERLRFYSEMIEDRMEEGLSEEEAVAAVGAVEEITAQITAEVMPNKQARKRKAWEIVLLVLGSPIWLSLLIAVFAVILSVWIAVWAVFIAVAAGAVGGVAESIMLCVSGHFLPGIAMIAAGIICMGLAIFLLFGCKAATKGLWHLLRNGILRIKNCFVKREVV